MGPDSAAVTLDDAVHDREADPSSFKLALEMEPLKNPNIASVSHIETGALSRTKYTRSPSCWQEPISTAGFSLRQENFKAFEIRLVNGHVLVTTLNLVGLTPFVL